ncbi:MAG: hypothetical protein QY323_04475 [Patescibacteria group bacterium]|nr:MAG: hypothetical protein QY323_04475 [Patescibacteria group bacterium]
MIAVMRKYALIVLFALMVYFGYKPVKEVVLGFRGVSYTAGVLSCDFEGRAYGESEQRQADDGCNVCTCGTMGWSCTNIACAKGAGTGTISGRLAAPEGERIPAQRVCAVNMLTPDLEYCQQTTDGTKEYVLAAKPGDYWVYATRVHDESGKRAYWSEHVTCGGGDACKDHSPILVRLGAGEVRQADPTDWRANVQIDLLNATPSKWEYSTHNYYPGSVFMVKGRGLAQVRVMATEYPQNPDASPYELGLAQLASEQNGIQTWTLEIPQGFQAWTVYAIGTDTEGQLTQSHTLRIVRPIETTL